MAYALGQIVGFAIIVAVIAGVVRTFRRRDLSTREKLVGKSKSSTSTTALTAGASPQPGWYSDPTGRSEFRWFDGSRWTDEVVVGGQQRREGAT